ncbi:unnamed protein product [Echinostoma caproni]|uniref:Uncharacterized protein n=1 Tax=Echinostoma caproni TaxID=27848 RepID=A0A183A762_9TREM|nr:unnamed protein product [Echinostoma caproni]
MLTSLTDPDLIDQVRFCCSATGSTTTDPGTADSRAPAFTTSSTQARLFTSSTLPEDICQRFAYQLVADYLAPDLADRLRSHLHLDNDCVDETASITGDGHMSAADGYTKENQEPLLINRKSQSTQPTEDYSEVLKKSELDKPVEVSSLSYLYW